MARYINCTPHPIVVAPDGGPATTYEPSGRVARLAESVRTDHDGTTVVDYGKVEGLPRPQKDTFYIVPLVVGLALRGKRSDLVVPYDQVRDANNSAVIGHSKRLARPE